MQPELIAVGTGLVGSAGVFILLYKALDTKINNDKKDLDEKIIIYKQDFDAKITEHKHNVAIEIGKKANVSLCTERHQKIDRDIKSRDIRIDTLISAVNALVVEVTKIGMKLDMFIEEKNKK